MKSIENFKIASITYPGTQVKPYYKYPENALYVRLYGVTLDQLKELATEYKFGGHVVTPTQTAVPERSRITQASDKLIEWRLTYNGEVYSLISRLSKILKQDYSYTLKQ